MTIVKREGLGRPMTWGELDGNFDAVEALRTEAAQSVAQSGANANASAASAGVAESARDEALEAAAQVENDLVRVIKAPEGEVLGELPVTGDRRDTLLGFGSNGQPVVHPVADFVQYDENGRIPGVIRGFDFNTHSEIQSINDHVYYDVDQRWYFWTREYPKLISPGDTPYDTGWVSLSDGSMNVSSFADALLSSGKHSLIRTLGHTLPGVGMATYIPTGDTGVPSSGTASKFYDADGSGWYLTNNGTVYYTQFGIGLNSSDDLPFVKQCHDYANIHGCEVRDGGELNIIANSSVNIDVRTSTLTPWSSVTCLDGVSGSEIYSINPSEDSTPFILSPEITALIQPELTKGSWIFPLFKNYPELDNSLILIENSERLSRRGAAGPDVLKQDSFIHFRDGNCLGHLLLDHTSGNLTITVRPLERNILKFGGMNVIQKFNDKTKRFTFVRSQRNMTHYEDIFVENDGELSDVGSSSSLIQGKCIAFGEVRNIDGENMNAGVSGNSGYVLSFQHCVGMYWERVSPNSGWGVVNTNWMKDWTIKDCYLNRIDNHYGIGNLTVENVDLLRTNIEIGFGSGTINLVRTGGSQSANSRITPDNEPISIALISLRAGWQLGYEGDINITNCRMSIYGNYPTIAERPWVGGVSYGRQNIVGCDPTVDFHIPNVNIDGLHLHVNGTLTAPLDFFGVLMWDEYLVSSDTNRVIAPDMISVKNMTSNITSDLVHCKPFKGITTSMSDARWVEKECVVSIHNCHNSTKRSSLLVTSLADYTNWMLTRSLFDWSLNNANQDASRVTFSIDVVDSTGSIYLNSNKGVIDCTGGEIVDLRAYGVSTNVNVSKIMNSKVWPKFRESGGGYDWYFADIRQSLLISNSEITPVNINFGTLSTVSLRDRQRINRCYTSSSAAINQTGVDRLWSSFEVVSDMYKKPTV